MKGRPWRVLTHCCCPMTTAWHAVASARYAHGSPCHSACAVPVQAPPKQKSSQMLGGAGAHCREQRSVLSCAAFDRDDSGEQ
jgi:hypothetical protein